MENIHIVKGGGGLNLHVREWGNAKGKPILFIHGWSQNHLSWKKQFTSSLAEDFRLVAFDLRGHGMSESPLESDCYTNPQLWADDIAAIIDQLDLNQPILVGWSYGGFIICDYLRVHGQSKVSGVNFVSAVTTLNDYAFGNFFGPGLLNNADGAMSEDLPTNIQAMQNFLHECMVKPISQDDFETALAFNVAVPAQVRSGLLAREIDSDEVLENMKVPVLVTHGKEDNIILPATAEHILNTCPTSKISWNEGVGHAPFLENPERFNAELIEFTQQIT